MRVLTDMLVSVLYHASSNVTLSDLVYMRSLAPLGLGQVSSRPRERIKRHLWSV